MNKEIELYLNDIIEYVNSALLYLTNQQENLDKDEIVMYLSSVEEIIDDIKKYLNDEQNKFNMNKEEVINLLYYLEDKVNIIYAKEVSKSINNFIKIINEEEQL